MRFSQLPRSKILGLTKQTCSRLSEFNGTVFILEEKNCQFFVEWLSCRESWDSLSIRHCYEVLKMSKHLEISENDYENTKSFLQLKKKKVFKNT